MRVNRWLDFIDRVAWTSVQSFGAAIVVLGVDDWAPALGITALAAAGCAAKVKLAQHAGDDDLGAAIPGKVLVDK